MRRISLPVLLVACAVLAGCAAPVDDSPSPAQTPPPIQSIRTPTPAPPVDSSSVDVETMKNLWDAASEEQRAEVLAEAGLTDVPDDVTGEMVDEAVQRAAAHGVTVTPEDVREFLAWVITR